MYIEGVPLTHWITLQNVSWLLAAALLHNTGPVSKLVVPISQLDTKLWENGVWVEESL